MFDHFKLNNIYSLYELYIVSNLDLSNFLEFLSLLIGIKSGYLYYKNLYKLYNLILFIENINQDDFIYIAHKNLIVNKRYALKYISIDELNSKNKIDSKIMGKLLGYPCPGIDFKHSGLGISFYLKVSNLFKEIFKIDNNYIHISGSQCVTNINKKIENYIENYKNKLDDYFKSINMGTVIVYFKQQN